jgi:hypothetical protein
MQNSNCTRINKLLVLLRGYVEQTYAPDHWDFLMRNQQRLGRDQRLRQIYRISTQ